MEIRFPPPRLQDEKDNVSTRTGKAESRVRCYPKPEQLCAWENFHNDVVEYTPPHAVLDPSLYRDIFTKRLRASELKAYNSEKGKERYLIDLLNATLFESRIVKKNRKCR